RRLRPLVRQHGQERALPGVRLVGIAAEPRRVRAATVALLVAAILATWVVTVERMRGMDAGPGTDLGSLGWYAGVWVTMMAAMMLPSALPMVLLVDRLSHERARRWKRLGSTWLFVASYLLPWTLDRLVVFR